MSYFVKQKIRGKIYVYEAEGYWDSEKQQARQRRRYLGVWDEETQSIIPKEAERDVRTTRSFGQAYLLAEICKESDVQKKLHMALNEDGNAVLALAMTKVINPSSLRNVKHIMEDSCLAEVCQARSPFTSQSISELLERVSKNERGMWRFYSSLVNEEEDVLVYDITSLSSYAKGINWLEYGDDYRKLDLPQVNLGLVVSIDRRIPIYPKLFPGSVNDVSTLRNLVAEVKELGVKECIFVLDRGFYSESNIEELLEQGMDFVMPLPFTTKISKSSISETNAEIEGDEHARRFGSDIYHVIEKDVQIGDAGIFAYILFNKKREADESESFYNRLMDIESKLEGKRVHGDAFDHFESVASNFRNYFECSVDGHIIHLARRPKAIDQAANHFGKMILISSSKRAWDDVLAIYRERDVVEKLYDELKNDLDLLPLHVHKSETLTGIVFVYFVTMVMRSLLLQRAMKAKLLNKASLEDIVLELTKLRVVQIGSSLKLTEVTKRQRTILEKMNIAVPVAPSLVIKSGGV